MCGIVGYIGKRDAAPILLEGLRRLEYRGYDSAGIAIAREGAIHVTRSVGKLASLERILSTSPVEGSIGLGHTRWATHGKPSEGNAHPHRDCTGALAVIHNGIIENHASFRLELAAEGHSFSSETDTEIAAHLIERELRRQDPALPPPERLLQAVRAALRQVHGAYALAVIWAGAPDVIVAAKTSSPLVIGVGAGEYFMASDVPAFLKHTREAIFLEDGELALVSRDSCRFFDLAGRSVSKSPATIQWDHRLAEKGGFRHFMLKETHEQPLAVENTLRGRLLPLQDGVLEREAGLRLDFLKSVSSIHLVACGTAYHAAIVGKYLLERHLRIPTQVETASEFRYREPLLGPGTLIIAVSQSGETADTIAAAQMAKAAGAKVLAVCNTVGSTLSRLSDFNLYTHCGPECGVASTKAFIGQLVALDVLTLHAAVSLGRMPLPEAEAWSRELGRLPSLIREALELEAQVVTVAKELAASNNFLYIGRTLNYPTAVEGALKLKEISYIHAEGYPAGEMKHGPLALISEGLPVVAIATQSNVFEKIVSNIEEARARGARLVALCTRGETRLSGKAEFTLEMPPTSEFISPIINVIPLQLLAYHIADLRGCDVDQPRNLAKSVTVE